MAKHDKSGNGRGDFPRFGSTAPPNSSTRTAQSCSRPDQPPPGPAAAQALIEAHLHSDMAGRCTTCEQPTPCHTPSVAHAALLAAGLLPMRRKGIGRSAVAETLGGSADCRASP